MNQQFLDTVFTNHSIRHPNFFNGRILTATDLREEQAAGVKRSRYLGQAVGSGVVYGLAVAIAPDDPAALTVTNGLAVNPRGEALSLQVGEAQPPDGGVPTTQIRLTAPAAVTQPASKSPFVPCEIGGAPLPIAGVRTGHYLLAITTATRLSGSAPNSGFDGDRPGCTHRHEEIGVQFKLIPLTTTDFPGGEEAHPDNRSRLAHLCLGTHEVVGLANDLLQAPASYGLLDRLRQAQRLTDCDVPLAAFHFQPPRVRFVDMWTVRRPCWPDHRDQGWLHTQPSLVGRRRAIEARAFLLQFQQQIADLRARGQVGIRARDVFEYLPAAGYLPTGTATQPGFALNTFFADTPVRHVNLDPSQVRSLFHQSFSYDPMPPDSEAIAVYPVVMAGQAPQLIFLRRELVPTLRSPGPCTYTLTPENWETSLTQIDAGVDDIHLCLTTGDYALTRPLLVRNKGHVKVTGAGLGTRLRSLNAEAALRFENCQSVMVRDLYTENNLARAPQTSQHLQGTLSFYDCPQVTVEAVAVRCLSRSQRNATCITVSPRRVSGGHQLSDVVSTVRIQRCQLDVGDRQVGILLVNTRYAQVDNNQIAAAQPENPAAQGIVGAGAIAEDVRILHNTLRNTLQGIHVGVSHHETSRGDPDRIGNLLILGNTLHIAFPNVSRRIIQARHGIFVGNCHSLVIENNFLSVRRFSGTANANIDGIRIHGFLGQRMIIRQNHLTSANTRSGFSGDGIRFTNLNNEPRTAIEEHNIVE